MIDYYSDDEARLRREMRGFSEIDPAIRKQLTRQYREWNNARSKQKGELKCNRCKNYFPRDLLTRVYTGNGRWWNAYCDECLAKRNPRMARRRYEEAT